MIRARSARLRRVVAVRTHAVSCARSCAATANLVATAMPCLHHAITGMASELTRRDTSGPRTPWRGDGGSGIETGHVDRVRPRRQDDERPILAEHETARRRLVHVAPE